NGERPQKAVPTTAVLQRECESGKPSMTGSEIKRKANGRDGAGGRGGGDYLGGEGGLVGRGAFRAVGFFTGDSPRFAERWARRAGMAAMAIARPFAYAASRSFATRFLHTLLRGVSRDRLDLLGEEYFHYVLRPQLRPKAETALREAIASGERLVLVGQ